MKILNGFLILHFLHWHISYYYEISGWNSTACIAVTIQNIFERPKSHSFKPWTQESLVYSGVLWMMGLRLISRLWHLNLGVCFHYHQWRLMEPTEQMACEGQVSCVAITGNTFWEAPGYVRDPHRHDRYDTQETHITIERQLEDSQDFLGHHSFSWTTLLRYLNRVQCIC